MVLLLSGGLKEISSNQFVGKHCPIIIYYGTL